MPAVTMTQVAMPIAAAIGKMPMRRSARLTPTAKASRLVARIP
jgi:hypothetical protein